MAINDLTIFQNVVVPATATGSQTGTIGEPSLANNGTQIFCTGNWYAARSLANAATWAYVSPFTSMPAPSSAFCCDQTVIYDPTRDLTIWLLQYVKQSNTNTLRIAVKRGTGGTPWSFYYDLTPGGVDPAWANDWFDYNSAALSNDYLYVSTNMFAGSDDVWRRSVVFRISLDLLAAGSAMSYNVFQTTANGSLRCTLGARETMYFASHNSTSSIRLFTWPQSSTSVTFNDIAVTPYMTGSYSAPGPDGNNWLSRCDSRITGGWLARGEAWFVWSANRQTGRPFPFVRAVHINVTTKTRVGEPDIWSSSNAYAYPDGCVNDAGDIGLSVFRGGGSIFPSYCVGVWMHQNSVWQIGTVAAGTNGPGDGKWGDYLTCRRHSPDGFTFIASGYTLQGGTGRANVQVRYVHFGQEKYTRAVARWINA